MHQGAAAHLWVGGRDQAGGRAETGDGIQKEPWFRLDEKMLLSLAGTALQGLDDPASSHRVVATVDLACANQGTSCCHPGPTHAPLASNSLDVLHPVCSLHPFGSFGSFSYTRHGPLLSHPAAFQVVPGQCVTSHTPPSPQYLGSLSPSVSPADLHVGKPACGLQLAGWPGVIWLGRLGQEEDGVLDRHSPCIL